jgi:hypothetical protein
MESTRNRPANLEELERVLQATQKAPGNWFTGFRPEAFEEIILQLTQQSCLKNSEWEKAAAEDDTWPLVVYDFSTLPKASPDILLIPPGIYEIPADFLVYGEKHLIGLSAQAENYPTLVFQGKSKRVNNDGPEKCLAVCDIQDWRFSNVRLDAREPTVLEGFYPSPYFRDSFMECTFGYNIDVLHEMVGPNMDEGFSCWDANGRWMPMEKATANSLWAIRPPKPSAIAQAN